MHKNVDKCTPKSYNNIIINVYYKKERVITLINFERNHQVNNNINSASIVPNTNNSPRYNRYVGYNDESSIRDIIAKLYVKTKTNGVLIKTSIPKPSQPEIVKITELITISNDISKEYIYNSIVKLISSGSIDFSKFGFTGDVQKISDLIYSIMEDCKQKGALSSTLKSSFISFICWFIRYNTYTLTNILYMGTPSKHEIYWLYIMHNIGCEVSTVSFIDDNNEYLKTDTTNKYSNLIMGNKFNPLNIDFKSINVADYIYADKMNEINREVSNLKVSIIEMVSQNNVEQELSTLRSQRINTSSGTIESTYFVLLCGFDEEDAYRNMLFNIRKNITNSPKPLIFIDSELEKPTYDEGAEFYNISRNNKSSMLMSFIERLEVPTSKDRTILAKQKFLTLMSNKKDKFNKEPSINTLFGMCVNVCVWFKQCVELVDFSKCDVPVFFFYGKPKEPEFTLMELLSSIGFDILIACPDKAVCNEIINLDINGIMQKFEYSNTGTIKDFPTQLVRAKVATTAYNASRDLDNILYNDGCMFRDHHYNFCQTATLQTTFEEIDLLWNAEAKYRPGFSSDEHTVTVPNIFAKLDGIPYGDTSKYIKEIQNKLTPNSIYYKFIPFFKPNYGINDFTGFFNGNRLDLAKIKLNRNINKYSHMPDNIQDLIFQKMQEVIDSGYLKIKYPDVMHLTIKVGTMLPNNLLPLIQNFDFTKDIPKIVIIHSTKIPFSAYECILLLLLNFIGFDIIIYTPTGYKNIETYIDNRAFEQYNIGEFNYNLVAPNMKIPKAKPIKRFGFFRK